MTFLRIASFLLPGLLASSLPAFSQLAPAEASLAASVATAQRQYAQSFFSHPQLYNGPEYLDYAKRYYKQEGHQFYVWPTMQPGRVFYNNHQFEQVQLVYDIVLDQVVLSPPGSPVTLRLVNEFVRDFNINDRHFVRLVADSASSAVIRTGYYQLLLNAPVQVLAKRTKRTQERVAQQQRNVEFTSKDRLFIKKQGVYYPIKGKSAAMRLFADRAPEMQAYLKEQKLSFRKADFEASLVQLARHYTELPAR